MFGNTSEDLILYWNYYFPLDRWWRGKYEKSLFSEEHLNANQYDITLEYLEEKLFESYLDRAKKEEKIEKEYKQGIWLRKPEDSFTEKQLSNLFDKIDISTINEQENK